MLWPKRRRVDTSERARGTYLGGHEIAALAGANPWLTVPDVYARYALGAPRGPVRDTRRVRPFPTSALAAFLEKKSSKSEP